MVVKFIFFLFLRESMYRLTRTEIRHVMNHSLKSVVPYMMKINLL